MAKHQRLGTQSCALEYLNNHIPQKVVRETLKRHGVTDAALSLIDWNKSKFPGPKFSAIFPMPLAKWPGVTH